MCDVTACLFFYLFSKWKGMCKTKLSLLASVRTQAASVCTVRTQAAVQWHYLCTCKCWLEYNERNLQTKEKNINVLNMLFHHWLYVHKRFQAVVNIEET